MYIYQGGVKVPKVEQKQAKINVIKENLEGASAVVVVDYRGLTVEQDTNLRKSLREANVTYKVYKNSMMKFAFKGTDFEQLNEHLAGPSAIAISYEDATAGARIIANNAKEYKNLEFKAGVVEGIYYDLDAIKKVATIPSRDELLSKLLGSLKSPISSFARTIKALAEKVEEQGANIAADVVGVTETKEETVEAVETTEEAVVEAVETTEEA